MRKIYADVRYNVDFVLKGKLMYLEIFSGLLHGTGLADDIPLPRYDADVIITSLANNSESKYIM